MHSCNNPWCVNPRHITAGTQQQNLEYMRELGRGGAPPRILTAAQEAEVIAAYIPYSRTNGSTQLAEKYGVPSRTIRAIIARNKELIHE